MGLWRGCEIKTLCFLSVFVTHSDSQYIQPEDTHVFHQIEPIIIDEVVDIMFPFRLSTKFIGLYLVNTFLSLPLAFLYRIVSWRHTVRTS